MYRVSNVTQHAIREYFDAVVKNPDFSEVNQLVKSLNDYIERTTNNTIKNMMSEGVWCCLKMKSQFVFHEVLL